MVEPGGTFNKGIATFVAIVGALSAALTLYIKWDDWFGTKQSCTISGTVTSPFTGRPVPGVALGWSPYANEPYGSTTPVTSANFTKIAESGSDGKFSGNCKGAQDNAANQSFMLLYTGGVQQGQLPCLHYKLTNLHFRNTGNHNGVNVSYSC
jgi:hypothetical protein